MVIKGKLVVLTGASKGIGRTIAVHLVKKGARVAAIARNRDELAKLRKEQQGPAGRIYSFCCDITNRKMVTQVCNEVITTLGAPDILINCAGSSVWKDFMDITEAEHREMMNVNYWGTYYFIRELLPVMLEQKRGKIINIAAGSGKFALSVTSGYSASKFAVVGLSEALHRELMGTGVCISCLNPGSVKTGFWNEDRVPPKGIPPLVRYSPKLSTGAVARRVVLSIWFPVSTWTFPFFVALLAKLNALWIRIGDLMLWKWFLPVTAILILVRLITKYLL